MAKFLAIIPARGGSKGIVDKNILPIAEKPLIAYTIEAANKSRFLNEVMVSTDSERIARIAREWGANVPFMRPAQLADDTSTAMQVIEQVVDEYQQRGSEFDWVVYLQPTSPLRTSEDIDAAIERVLESPKERVDSLVSVMDVPHQFALESLMIEESGRVEAVMKKAALRRQDKASYVARNGPAIVITCYKTLKQYRNLYGEQVLSYKMPAQRSVDIDSYDDVAYVEFLIEANKT